MRKRYPVSMIEMYFLCKRLQIQEAISQRSILGFAKSFLALIRRKTLIFSVYDETSGVSDRCMDKRVDQFSPKEHRPFWSLYLERGKKEQKKKPHTIFSLFFLHVYTLKHTHAPTQANTQTNAHAYARAN